MRFTVNIVDFYEPILILHSVNATSTSTAGGNGGNSGIGATTSGTPNNNGGANAPRKSGPPIAIIAGMFLFERVSVR